MSEMNMGVVLTCAVTGGGDTADKHPDLPITPEQIAGAAIEAAKAGASVAHCHVRDPETGKSVHSHELFAEVTERIRDSETDIVINLTGGNGGAMIIDDANPRVMMDGSDITTPEARVATACKLQPEISSLDMGNITFGDNVIYAGHPTAMRDMAKRMQDAGVKPEIEVFDTGPIVLANQMVAEGLLDAPPLFQLCLGIGYNAPMDTKIMIAMRDMMPEGAAWSSFGISRHQMGMVAKSVALGGNARVGLEDNLYLSRGVLASNGQLVEKARGIIEAMGSRVLTPQETREKLNLNKVG